MKIYIVIPAHNEARFIGQTLNSLSRQSLKPDKLVVVDDGSTDETFAVAEEYAQKHSFIQVIKNHSSTEHAPGSKVINAFYKGYYQLDDDFDVIC